MLKYLIFIIFTLALHACKNNSIKIENKETENPQSNFAYKLEIKLLKEKFPLGENIHGSVKILDTSLHKPVLKIFVNDSFLVSKEAYSVDFQIKTSLFHTGKHKIYAQVFSDSNMLSGKAEMGFFVYSDLKPKQYLITIINTYPHDQDAYTQGLEFFGDFLYEGTGQNGKSSLRKTNYRTSEILQNANIDKQYFGEGITILNNKIYQLTWESNVGFVYDVQTLKKLDEFSYPTEGWGLTNDGKNLWMSDGTENIYVLDPVYFNQIKKLEVYNEDEPVKFLNELEWINGKIYANIYYSTKIAIIDPLTGRVEAFVDASGLESKMAETSNRDVLNGIAFNPETKSLFLTGKRWPLLFEVELKPVN